jgi:hypothetical protein
MHHARMIGGEGRSRFDESRHLNLSLTNEVTEGIGLDGKHQLFIYCTILSLIPMDDYPNNDVIYTLKLPVLTCFLESWIQ